MIKLFRVGSFWLDRDSSLSVYRDSELIDISFDFGGWHEYQERRLTKFRSVRKSGEFVSLEIRGGVVSGIEMLGVQPGRWDNVSNQVSREISSANEIPIFSMELDGNNSTAEVDSSCISQCQEFTARWCRLDGSLEIEFDQFVHSSDFGCGQIFYNQYRQLSGIRVIVGDSFGKL